MPPRSASENVRGYVYQSELDGAAELDERSLDLRRLVVKALEGGGRGHLGSALSLIEILRSLYDNTLRFDSKKPDPDTDRSGRRSGGTASRPCRGWRAGSQRARPSE